MSAGVMIPYRESDLSTRWTSPQDRILILGILIPIEVKRVR